MSRSGATEGTTSESTRSSPLGLFIQLLCTCVTLCALAPDAGASTAPSGQQDARPSVGAFTVTNGPVTTPDSPRIELVFLGSPPDGLSTGEVLDAMERAASAWTDVTCAYIEVGVGGIGRAESLAEGEVPVVFVDPAEQPVCLQSGSRLAAAPCPVGETFGIVLNARDFRWSAEADQQPLVFGEETIHALDAVLTHELGHILGLGHSNDVAGATGEDPGLKLATMFSAYLIDGGQLTLSADDRRGLCSLYPIPDAPECEDDAECIEELSSAGATCDDTASPRVCEEERGEVGDYCSSALQICEGWCIETIAARTGYCTVECDASAEDACPAGFACETREFSDGETRDLCIQQSTPLEAGSCSSASGDRPVGRAALLLMVSLVSWPSRRRRLRRAR